MMRYHYGLGVGHASPHGQCAVVPDVPIMGERQEYNEDLIGPSSSPQKLVDAPSCRNADNSETNSEFESEKSCHDSTDGSEYEGRVSEDDDDDDKSSDDDELLAMDEMYGDSL